MIAGKDTHTILLKFANGVSNDDGPLLASASDGRPAPSPAPMAPPPVSGFMSDNLNPGLLRLPAAVTPPPRPRARVIADDEPGEAVNELED
jgi:hypothetical protein